MKLRHKLRLLLAVFALVVLPVLAQQQLELVDPPPITGTFYFAQRTNVPPFWFDPYAGQLPVYRIDGHKYLIDDTSVDYGNQLRSGGGEMMLSGPPKPCEVCPPGDTNSYPKYIGGWTTNSGLKFAWTPYVTNGTSYVTRLIETQTNTAYLIFRTLEMQPQPSNTVWRLVASGATNQVVFTNAMPSTNYAFYLAANVADTNSNGLPDAYEYLVKNDSDSDGDGIPDGIEVWFRLNPLSAEPPFTITISQPVATP